MAYGVAEYGAGQLSLLAESLMVASKLDPFCSVGGVNVRQCCVWHLYKACCALQLVSHGRGCSMALV